MVSGADPRATLLGWVGASDLPDDLRRDVARPRLPQRQREDQPRARPAARVPRPHGRGPGPRAPRHDPRRRGRSRRARRRVRGRARGARARTARSSSSRCRPRSTRASRRPGGTSRRCSCSGCPCEAPAERWPALRDAIAERACAQVEEVAPGFTASILHREVLAPPDLEQLFGLTGGNLFHGAMTPDRLALLRPLAGLGALCHADPRALAVRRGHAPGRRRDGRVRAQRGARDPADVLRQLG